MAENDIDPEMFYEDALALVFRAIRATRRALNSNPSKEEERKLNKRLLRLEAERADLEAMLDAIIDGEALDVAPPTPADVENIANLTKQVAGLTKANLTAAGALNVTSKVLDLAMKVTA